MIDLIDYLVGSIGNQLNIRVGGVVSWPVDLSVFDSRVTLKDPAGARIESVARPIGDGREEHDDVLCRVQFDEINRRGFYEIALKQHSGPARNVLFASNLDPRESRLKRLNASAMDGDFFSDRVKRISVADVKNEKVSSGNTEIWPQIVWFLLCVLATEQFSRLVVRKEAINENQSQALIAVCCCRVSHAELCFQCCRSAGGASFRQTR